MARPKSIPIRQHLRKLFPAKRLNALARATGASRRVRKVQPVNLFWTVVLGFNTGRDRTLAGMRRAYERATAQCIEESSFFNRFNAGFAKMMRLAFAQALQRAADTHQSLKGPLSSFSDVLIADSTVVRLHELLQKSFPACRTNHTKAALKLHTVMSVKTAGCQSVKLTGERQHDGPVLRAGKWMKDRLLIFDLGYFRYQLFARITQNGGYFLSRLKGNCDPLIVASHRRYRGHARKVVGRRLREVVGGLQRELLDVIVEVDYRRQRCLGVATSAKQCLRVIGVRDDKTGEHHLYITNVGPETLAAEEIRTVYASRWQVELLFKEWKQFYRLEQLPSSKREVVEALIFAALISALVSQSLLVAVKEKLKSLAARLPAHRWASLFAQASNDLLLIILMPRRKTPTLLRIVTQLLLFEAVDPNASRLSLIAAVETRQHAYRRRTA